MKKLKNLVVIPLLFIAISCSSTLDETSSLKLKKVEDDIILKQYIATLADLTTFEKNDRINLEKFVQDFSNISSESDLREKVNRYYKDPNAVLSTINDLNRLSVEFNETNEYFVSLSETERETVISNSVDSFLNDKLNAKVPSGGGNTGVCEDQMASDKHSCFQYALVGGAACGLLTPTLIGAGLCYLTVMAADAVCHTQAENDYAICTRSGAQS